MNNNDPHTLVDDILAMTDTERSDALCFIAGYSPEAVAAAFKNTEQDRMWRANHAANVQAARLIASLS